MEIIVFDGGLGNQMFQYAFYLAKRKVSKSVCYSTYPIKLEQKHNGYELDTLFGLQSNFPQRLGLIILIARKFHFLQKEERYKTAVKIALGIFKLFGVKIISEKGVSTYNDIYLKHNKGIAFFFGFWQTERYFAHIQNEIRSIYSFNHLNLSEKSQSLLSLLKTNESVSVHVRRGDFLNVENEVSHNVCTKDYYDKAIARMNSLSEKPLFVVFSDDIDWVKQNLSFPDNTVYVDWNSGMDSWQDMYLMSQCKNNIIANSSFSWWGAWLNVNSNKRVIAPHRFFNDKEAPDVFPEGWITN